MTFASSVSAVDAATLKITSRQICQEFIKRTYPQRRITPATIFKSELTLSHNAFGDEACIGNLYAL